MANSIKNTIINWTVAQTPTVQSNEIFTNIITLSNEDESESTLISSSNISTSSIQTSEINTDSIVLKNADETMSTVINSDGIISSNTSGDVAISTTISPNNVFTSNLTTTTINDGDLTFGEDKIVVDKVLSFSGAAGEISSDVITVDLSFDATSTNPQSGVAVTEALKTIPLAWTKNGGDTLPTSYGYGGLAIGPKAKVTETDALAVGYNAQASYANTALGMNASAFGGTVYWSVAIGSGAKANESQSVVVGSGAISHNAYTCAIGRSSLVSGGVYSIALGASAKVYKSGAIALGYNAKVNDAGAAAISVFDTTGKSQTLFYIIGKNTPLANKYEDGMACLGYVVKDENGNILECGTRKLSELLTNNTAFAPTDLETEATPFMPTDISEPIELPKELYNITT